MAAWFSISKNKWSFSITRGCLLPAWLLAYPTNKGTEIVNKNCKASSSTTGAISLKTMRQVFCAISSFKKWSTKTYTNNLLCIRLKTKFFGLIKRSWSGSSTYFTLSILLPFIGKHFKAFRFGKISGFHHNRCTALSCFIAQIHLCRWNHHVCIKQHLHISNLQSAYISIIVSMLPPAMSYFVFI